MAQFSTWLGWLSLAVWRFWWLGSGLKLIRLDSFIAYWIVFEDHIQYSNYLIFKYTTKTFQLFHTNWYTVFLSPKFLRLVRRREHRYRKTQTKLQQKAMVLKPPVRVTSQQELVVKIPTLISQIYPMKMFSNHHTFWQQTCLNHLKSHIQRVTSPFYPNLACYCKNCDFP